MTDLRMGYCPIDDESPILPRHIVEVEVVRVEEHPMSKVQYLHYACRNCGASDDTIVVLDNSLPFEVNLLGISAITLG